MTPMTHMTNTESVRLVMVAGESSGDQLAAVLLTGMHARYAQVSSAGIVGEAMVAQGAQAWWSSQSLAVRGYFEPIKHLPRILKMRSELIERTIAMRPDVFIGIDAPDFNLGVETQLRAQGVPTMHYVSPSIWAWRAGRIEKIRRAVDHMLLIFPFEQKIYDDAGIPATYVGHPFAQQIPLIAQPEQAKQILGIDKDAFALALLPGSRASEIQYNAPNFFKAAQLIAQRMGVSVKLVCLVPIAHANLRAQLLNIQQEHAPNLSIHWFDGQARTIMEAADATIVASGTASLEVALYKKPSIISYQTSWLSAKIYPHVALQPWIGLPNILMRQHFIPEILQNEATTQGLADALTNEIERYAKDASVHEQLTQMHESLIADTPNLCVQAIEQVRTRVN